MFEMRFRTTLALAVIVAVVLLVSPVLANLVTNASFEDGPLFRGAGTITGWAGTGTTGLAPWPTTGGYPSACDNGNPGSDWMAYLDLTGSSISQTIHGLKANASYHLTYRDNSGTAWVTSSQVTVKIGTETLDWHYFSPVDPPWTYTTPFYTRNIDFVVPADGDYVLSFTQTGVVPSGLDPRYHPLSYVDGIVLTQNTDTVFNGSFEIGTKSLGGTPTGWTIAGDAGLSGWPPTQGYPQVCDNGNPGSDWMVYLKDPGAKISQTIYGMKAHAKYHLKYRDNSVNAWTNNSQVTAKIGDRVVDFQYIPPVDGHRIYNNPFYTREVDFYVPADGDYVLSFAQTGSTSLPNHTCSLIDGIEVSSIPTIVANGSFEADSFAAPGYVSDNGPISSWESVGNTGVSTFGRFPNFADNGATPDGTNVAFLEFTGAKVSQTLHLKAGYNYSLTYRDNSATAWVTGSQVTAKIDDQLLDWHYFGPVDPPWTYVTPYYTRPDPLADPQVPLDFNVWADGDYTLSFTQTGVVPAGLDPRYHVCSLLDNVVVTETPLAPLETVIDYSDAVTVDGNLSDWADADWQLFDYPYDKAPSYPDGPFDIQNADGTPNGSAWAAKWGAGGTKVYIAVKVLDVEPYGAYNTHMFTNTYDDWNTRDAVELYLHTNGTSVGPYGTNNYADFQEQAQEWSVGIKDNNRNAVWKNSGYLPAYTPPESDFQAAGNESGDWLYYEAALTPYQYFGGRRGNPSIVSPLHENNRINTSVVAVANADYTYTGMKSHGPGGSWSANYTTVPQAQLVRTGVKGTITLTDFGSSTLGAVATIVIKDASNVTETHSLVLDGSGTYSFKTNLSGTCTATASAYDYPSQTKSVAVTAGNGAVSFVLAHQTAAPVSIADAKKMALGSPVIVSGSITAAFDGSIYIEASDRVSGIRVDKAIHGFTASDVGKVISVTGAVAKDSATNELYIDASAIDAPTSTNLLAPLALTNKSAGGGDFVTAGNGQVGVADGTGLNNIGLLVRTTGKASAGDANGFTLTDGSGVTLNVSLAGAGSAYNGKYVTVTGISSIGSGGVRVLKARTTSDVQIVVN